MHSYRRTDGGKLWTVGFETATQVAHRGFRPIKDFETEALAAAYTSFLNGGADISLATLIANQPERRP